MARAQARRFLERGGAKPDAVAAACTVVSELVANAVVHGSEPIKLELRLHEDTLRVEVCDGDPKLHAVMADSAAPDGRGGRGLRIVSAFARAWGVRAYEHGKFVWAHVSVA